MKKIYVKPETVTVKVDVESLLEGTSKREDGGLEEGGANNNNMGFEEDDVQLSAPKSLWEE